MIRRDEPPRHWSTRLPSVVGYAAVILLVGAVGSWSVGTEISGAVIARGVVEVETDLQIVQHAEGGVVGDIRAVEGEEVQAGDILIKLDDTFLRSELAIVERQLHELFARRARLTAERDGLAEIDFSTGQVDYTLDQSWMQAQFDGQINLFKARAISLEQEVETLRERQHQSKERILGIEGQIAAAQKELGILYSDIADQQTLFAKKMVPKARMLLLQREAAELEGDVARYRGEAAQERREISEVDAQILGMHSGRIEDVIAEMRDLRYAEIELEERRLNLQEKISRLDVRAPVDGTVFETRVFAIKSVIQPGQPIMHIVPKRQPMRIAAQVDPIHVEQVYPGQMAMLRFTSYNHRTTPQVPGAVVRLSPDTLVSDQNGAPYYEAVVIPDPTAMAALEQVEMKPGMPVEAYFQTEMRRPLDYLTQPFTDYFNRAYRE